MRQKPIVISVPCNLPRNLKETFQDIPGHLIELLDERLGVRKISAQKVTASSCRIRLEFKNGIQETFPLQRSKGIMNATIMDHRGELREYAKKVLEGKTLQTEFTGCLIQALNKKPRPKDPIITPRENTLADATSIGPVNETALPVRPGIH